MSRWRQCTVVAVALLALITACEADEFDDAPTATASSSEQGSQSYGDEGSQQPSGSAGPIEGSDRPPGHPTLEGDEAGAQGGAQGGAQDGMERPPIEEYGESGPIRWKAPAGWQAREPANDMRFAEYTVEADEGSAELSVFYFGPEGAGGVDANLERWASQLHGGDEPVRDERDVGGMTVHTVDASGTYHTDMPMGGGSEPEEDQRLLGAIAEATVGLFFFRFVGDEAVVAEQQAAFDEFVESLEDGG